MRKYNNSPHFSRLSCTYELNPPWLKEEGIWKDKEIAGYRITYSPPKDKHGGMLLFSKNIYDVPFSSKNEHDSISFSADYEEDDLRFGYENDDDSIKSKRKQDHQ